MTVVTVGIIGIMTVLMAVQLKSMKGEYGLYLVLAAACVIFLRNTETAGNSGGDAENPEHDPH